MSLAAPDLLQTYWAIPVGAVFFMAPGYLLAAASNFFGFRGRSRREQLLWAVALSMPVSLVLAQLLGRLVGAAATLGLFELIVCGAAVMGVYHRTDLERGEPLGRSRYFATVVGCMVALAVLLPLETTDIQVGHRLFESTVMYDWAVRVPMVRAAMEGGVPPLNPLSALTGNPAPLHYYYFWYVLVADLCRIAHVNARAGMQASTVWAAWDFLAVLFLCLKYFVGLRDRLRESWLAAMLTGCVMGLDLIPALLLLLAPGLGMNIEMEWWHPDRSPSWLSTFLYAPHHIAGIASCMIGFLAVVSSGAAARENVRRALFSWLWTAVIAGFCFGAVAGTSTFVTLVFAIICLLWAVRAAIKREWMTIAVLAAAAVFALAVTHSFLHEMGSATATVSGPGHALTKFALRNSEFVKLTLAKHHVEQHHRLLADAIRVPAILLLTFAEFGFFTFVFFHRVRRDFFQRRTMSLYEQGLWTVFAGAAVVALFVSSGVDGPNDLGMHAGMILKFVLLLWAAPWVDSLLRHRREFRALSFGNKALAAVGLAVFLLGFAGSGYQALLERTLFPLHEAGIIRKKMDTYGFPAVSYRLYDVKDAYRQAAHLLPSSSIVQFNPDSMLQPAFGLYATRQLAASDEKCGTPFGGDESLCYQIYPAIRSVFGGMPAGVAPARVELADLDALCRRLSVSAVFASSVDPVWTMPQSWAWTRAPLYANDSVRVIPCGTATTK